MPQDTNTMEAFRALGQGMWTGMHALASDLRAGAGRGRDLEREAEVRDLLTSYTYFYDGDDPETLEGLFHPDIIVTNPRGTYQGREAVMTNYRYLMSERRVCLHYLTNTLVVLAGSDAARCGSFWYAVEVDNDQQSWGTGGTYLDQVVRSDASGWQIATRRITHNFSHRLPEASGRTSQSPPVPSSPENSREWVTS